MVLASVVLSLVREVRRRVRRRPGVLLLLVLVGVIFGDDADVGPGIDPRPRRGVDVLAILVPAQAAVLAVNGDIVVESLLNR